jgi:hypothetical protein
MNEVFDEKFILRAGQRQADFRLYNAIYSKLLEMVEEAKFFYNISAVQTVLLQQDFTKADCIMAPLTLHKTNNIEGVLKNIKGKLNRKGLFVGNFFGLENLRELGELLASEDAKIIGQPLVRMLPLLEIKTIGGLLQKAGFKNVMVFNEEICFDFANLKEALQFLQKSGEANCLMLRERSLLNGNVLKKYIESFKNPITLKFDVCFFSCLNS